MKKNKQIDLPLFPPVASPTVREIQIATRGIDLFDPKNQHKIVKAVAECCYGINIMDFPANTEGIWEFASQCYNDALVAHSAYNPYRGF